MLGFFVLLCFAHVVVSFQNVHPDAKIDPTARLGSFVDIDTGVIVKAHAHIGSFASIASSTLIGENTNIGSHAKIGQRCNIENNVTIKTFAKFGNDNVLRSGSVFAQFSSIGNNVIFGNRVVMNEHAVVNDGAEIGDDSFLDEFSSVDFNVKILPKAYIGPFSFILSNAIVNEGAVIYESVEIPQKAVVNQKQVVISTPSTFTLYQSCAPIDSILSGNVEIAAKNDKEFNSKQFNVLLRSMMDSQVDSLIASCKQTQMPAKLEQLPTIKTLYLIRYQNLDRFKENFRIVQNATKSSTPSIVISKNGVRMDSSASFERMQELAREYHFGETAEKEILEPDVQKKFVQLLAIDQDASRVNRGENDTYYEMIGQIRNGDREVTCAKRSRQELITFENLNISF
ncbi:uncharacterized protein LOC116348794 [Contarinia nasturtii]|uniref:uncharacterized protein LOC116348794 n=1 Tax=Contarinia nasturtii TaxID=265458 RepID=UPI0012D3C833|nr:uncharacterized protein LOC116348794 [Contarinia nasturtii]